MKSPKDFLLINKARDLGIDITNGWPDELSFHKIVELQCDDKDSDTKDAFIKALQESTFDQKIEVHREGYHLYDLHQSGDWQKEPLQAAVIKEVERASRMKEQHKISGLFLSFGGQLALSSAKVRLNLEPVDLYQLTELYEEHQKNYIVLNWFYSAHALSLWLEAVGELPSELLSLWFIEKGCLRSNVPSIGDSNNLKEHLDIRALFINFPSRVDVIADAIFAATRLFIKEYKEYPLQNQLWIYLSKSPRIGFEINKLPSNKKILLIEGEELERETFRTRWLAYTKGSKVT